MIKGHQTSGVLRKGDLVDTKQVNGYQRTGGLLDDDVVNNNNQNQFEGK